LREASNLSINVEVYLTYISVNVKNVFLNPMAENLIVLENATKAAQYQSLLPQIGALIDHKVNIVANMANVCAAIKQTFDFFWIGFYLVENGQLVLGPFQGPIACTTIQKGKGVCGTSWDRLETIIVPDVEAFPGHIACSSLSKSEIVVPVYNAANQCVGVLDIDSSDLNTFDETDKQYLEQMMDLLKPFF
jgi:L-methionine (R)-S-oxide reductase